MDLYHCICKLKVCSNLMKAMFNSVMLSPMRTCFDISLVLAAMFGNGAAEYSWLYFNSLQPVQKRCIVNYETVNYHNFCTCRTSARKSLIFKFSQKFFIRKGKHSQLLGMLLQARDIFNSTNFQICSLNYAKI